MYPLPKPTKISERKFNFVPEYSKNIVSITNVGLTNEAKTALLIGGALALGLIAGIMYNRRLRKK